MHMRRTTEHVWVCLVYIRAITMAAAGHTERLRASLAAEEREALGAIKSDLCEWLARPDVLTLDIVPVSFLQALDSGIQLCNVAVLVQNGAKRCMEDGEKLSVRIPMEPLFCNPIKAARGSGMFQANARDNAAKFIQWCRDLGVEEAVIFESVGLVEHTDERRVVLCLLDVARFADKVGIPPPQLVILEKEIAQLERQQISTCRNERNIDPVELHPKTVEEKEGDKKVIVTPEKKATKSDCKAMTGAKNQKESSNEKSDSDREEEEEEPPAKRVKHTKTDKRRVLSPHRQLPATHQSSPPPTYKSVHGANQHSQKRRKSTISSQKPGRKDTVDKKMMQCVKECTCEHAMKVENYGNGKFTVSQISDSDVGTSTKITIYARLLSDRVMVRVGGGWETLEHFLLKHDPCRINNIKTLKTGKRGREH